MDVTHERSVFPGYHSRAAGVTIDLWMRVQVLLAELAENQREPVPEGQQWQKNLATVLSLMRFLSALATEQDSVLAVVTLLDPRSARYYADFARGMVAGAVTILRQADGVSETADRVWLGPDMEAWLEAQIARLKPAPSFTIEHARLWFRQCAAENSSRSQATLDGFNAFQPDPKRPLSAAEAKAQAADFLMGAHYLTIAPLGKPPGRPRGRAARKRSRNGVQKTR